MHSLDDFELRPLHHSLLQTPQHELNYQGQGTGFVIQGSDVVAQYRWGDCFLIATVRENPKQEKLECYLLGAGFEQKAYCQYSGWFNTAFMVTGHQTLSDNGLEIQLNKTIRIQIYIIKKRLPWPRLGLSLEPQLK